MNASFVVAKEDISNAGRSRLLWGAVAVLLVVTVPDYLNMLNGELIDSTEQAVRFIPMIFQNFVAPLAMIVAYRAVVGERESGTVRVLFGHPVTRRDLVAGKVVSRGVLLATVVLIGAVGLAVTTALRFETLPVELLGTITAYTVFYSIVWAGITVGVSAAVSTRLQSIAVLLGLFLFLGPFQLWDQLAVPLFALAFTGSLSTAGFDTFDSSTWPQWYEYVARLNPMENFVQGRYAVQRVVDSGIGSLGPLDFFGFAAFVAWFAVPVAVGYWLFNAAELD